MVGFQWIIRDKLAAASQPGLYSDDHRDIRFLLEKGIRNILTLTENPVDIEDPKLTFYHFPIPDMGIPTPREAHKMIVEMIEVLNKPDERLLVHCKAGLGRTGTIIACILIEMGRTPEAAISEIRSIQSNYIQNMLQEKFVFHYFEFINSLKS